MFPSFANDNICCHRMKNFGLSLKRSYHGNAPKIDKRLAVLGLACITSYTDLGKGLIGYIYGSQELKTESHVYCFFLPRIECHLHQDCCHLLKEQETSIVLDCWRSGFVLFQSFLLVGYFRQTTLTSSIDQERASWKNDSQNY